MYFYNKNAIFICSAIPMCLISIMCVLVYATLLGCYPPPEQTPQVPTTTDEEETADDENGQNPLICGMSVELHFDGNYIRYKNYADEYLYTAVVDDESGTLLSSDYAWPAGNEFGWDTDIDEVDVPFQHGREITVSVEHLIASTDIYELCQQESFVLP